MKIALSFVALMLVAAVNAAPAAQTGDGAAGQGKYSTSKFFYGVLDSEQGALLDIAAAKEDLDRMELKLEALAAQKETILAAEEAMEAAVDSSVYENKFVTKSE